MSLPKDLYPLAKDVLIPSKWLFGDDLNARITNIKVNRKSKGDFEKSPEINTWGTKPNIRNKYTRKQ